MTSCSTLWLYNDGALTVKAFSTQAAQHRPVHRPIWRQANVRPNCAQAHAACRPHHFRALRARNRTLARGPAVPQVGSSRWRRMRSGSAILGLASGSKEWARFGAHFDLRFQTLAFCLLAGVGPIERDFQAADHAPLYPASGRTTRRRPAQKACGCAIGAKWPANRHIAQQLARGLFEPRGDRGSAAAWFAATGCSHSPARPFACAMASQPWSGRSRRRAWRAWASRPSLKAPGLLG